MQKTEIYSPSFLKKTVYFLLGKLGVGWKFECYRRSDGTSKIGIFGKRRK